MRKTRILAAFVAAGLALVMVMIGVNSVAADVSAKSAGVLLAPTATIVVTSTADSGPGTLRQALLDAVNGDDIGFDTSVFPPGNPQTITLSSALPGIITNNLTIDASNAGVILDGSGTPAGADGLVINGASNVTVKGLQILSFPGDGIILMNGAMSNTVEGNVISGNGENGMAVTNSGTMSNTISGNIIGTDASGTMTMTNQHSGISMWNSPSYNIIEDNLISGNGNNGIEISGSGTAHNIVRGNKIGTDVGGSFAIPNGDDGVLVEDDATYNTIGGDTPGERNLISGNNADGIDINGSGTMSNTVSGNYIGTNITGTAAIGNGDQGVQIGESASRNLVGGDMAGERNLISGNSGSGVAIKDTGTGYNTVSGNYIGTDVDGATAIANAGGGMSIYSGASDNTVGGSTAGERNLISGNGQDGIWIGGTNTMSNTVSGNYIGTDASGTAALGNGQDGIWIGQDASYNTIGGSTSGERNLISSNRRVGVSINGQGNSTSYNIVRGNYIGTDASGAAALGNGWGDPYTGVEIYYTANNVIVDNLISGNYGDGIHIQGDAASGNVVRGNFIGTDVSGTLALGNGTTTGKWGQE